MSNKLTKLEIKWITEVLEDDTTDFFEKAGGIIVSIFAMQVLWDMEKDKTLK